MILDLRDITFYVINSRFDYEQKAIAHNRLKQLQLRHHFVPAVGCEPSHISQSLSALKILEDPEIRVPFAIINDQSVFRQPLHSQYRLPEKTDALVLEQISGVEINNQETPDFEAFDEQYIRLQDNVISNGTVYISETYRMQCVTKQFELIFDNVDENIAAKQLLHKPLLLSPIVNPVFSASFLSTINLTKPFDLHASRQINQHSDITDVSRPNDLKLFEKDGDAFYLFYDIFIHWSGKKITAVAPYYCDDANLTEHHQDIWIKIDELFIKGKYVPCELASWEPSILIDFEHPELEKVIAERSTIVFTLKCKDISKTFELKKFVPPYDIALSVIIKNENRWIGFYLKYYLDILKADHVYIYDNYTKDSAELINIVKPYVQQSKVTLIPWSYRWRNRKDGKQIGQPPQETHSLNKYGHGKWIGFFDIDEFLNLRGQDLPNFLAAYDFNAIGSVSFGLRWFFYKGSKNFDQIVNPLVEFVHNKKDELGRKRQKLFASPKLARYARFHWVAKELKEVQIEDKEIFFHHYCFRHARFEEHKSQSNGLVDDSIAKQYLLHQQKQELEKFVDDCLLAANKEQSNLPSDLLSSNSPVGIRNRHFYHRLGSLQNCKLLSIGYFDEVLISSWVWKQYLETQFILSPDGPLLTQSNFLEKIKDPFPFAQLVMMQEEWWKTDHHLIDRCNIFHYHGETDYNSQYNVILHFERHFENPVILLIENWNEVTVRKATRAALQDISGKVFMERELMVVTDDEQDLYPCRKKKSWTNGIGVFGVCKI